MERAILVPSVVLVSLFSPSIRSDEPASCSGGEVFQVEIQGSDYYDQNWTSGYLWIYGQPYQQVTVMVRTRMTVTSGQTEGWSFGVEHDPSGLQTYGGSVAVNSVTTEGTDTATVNNGNAPGFDATQVKTGFNGYTQGIVIDTSSQATLAPTSDFVTSLACYTITMPYYPGYYSLRLNFSHDLGDPNVLTVISQEGSLSPCAKNFEFAIYVSSSVYPTSGGCTISQSQSAAQGAAPGSLKGLAPMPAAGGIEMQGLMAGSDPMKRSFRRGDSNFSGAVDISDTIYNLKFQFAGGIEPPCLDALDYDDSGIIDISDPVGNLVFQFAEGGNPPPPPGRDNCGFDPTEDSLDCEASPQCDFDGDGFLDDEELNGVPGPDGTSLDIAALGADPDVPDVFVEIDWMNLPGGHSHQPVFAGLQRVVDAFATPRNDKPAINLHIDTGPSGPADFDLGEGGPIDHTDEVEQPNKSLWESFEELKSQNFRKERSNVFHYCLFAHTVGGNRDPSTSGVAQADPNGTDLFTDDFIVSLGDPFWNATFPPGTELRTVLEGATFMHELGHALNLRHGGDDDFGYKPNYRSVMNLRYQFEGVDTDCAFQQILPNCNGVLGDGVIDYSHEVLPPLTETALNEGVGMCGGQAMDWDRSCTIDGGIVPANINCFPFPAVSGDCSQRAPQNLPGEAPGISAVPQAGHNDWTGGNMRYDFRNSPNRFFDAPNAGPGCGGAF